MVGKQRNLHLFAQDPIASHLCNYEFRKRRALGQFALHKQIRCRLIAIVPDTEGDIANTCRTDAASAVNYLALAVIDA